ncbi:MAG TPA: dephospho-CoA kinase [Nitrosomonas sp.]|nr:dephospho-CoA kinase [Nitrosomonas sp.]
MIVGLTGGIGSGKTSVAEIFQTLGITIIDTDEIAHELTQENGEAISHIKEIFGGEYITDTGRLDRVKMRNLVFTDLSMKKKLEEILHPLIYRNVEQLIPTIESLYGIVAIPLLFETGCFCNLIDRVLVVDCPEELQILRTVQRSKLSQKDVRAIIKTQISRKERLARANNIISNDRDFIYLVDQVRKLHSEFTSFTKMK